MDNLGDLEQMTVHSRKELDAVFRNTSSDKSSIWYGSRKLVHAKWTYILNCREARNENDPYIPFGSQALQRCPTDTMKIFQQIARSKLGQDGKFTFVFKDVMQSRPRRGIRTKALADFNGEDYGGEYLNFKTGDCIDVLPAPDGKSDGWAYGEFSGTFGWFPPTYV